MTQREMQMLAMQLQGGEDPPWKQGVKNIANMQTSARVQGMPEEKLLEGSGYYRDPFGAAIRPLIPSYDWMEGEIERQIREGDGGGRNLQNIDNWIEKERNGRPGWSPNPYRADYLQQLKNLLFQQLKLRKQKELENTFPQQRQTKFNQF